MIYLIIWTLVLIAIVGGVMSRILTRNEALVVLQPDLLDLREVIVAAHTQSNNSYTQDKLSYAVEVLNELTAR